MQIDVSKQIEDTAALTSEWAIRSGYIAPPEDSEDKVSTKAINAMRVLSVSDFGCQQRNVHALISAILGEKLPALKTVDAEYLTACNPPVGAVLLKVKTRGEYTPRAGRVTRVSKNGNVELRYSNSATSEQCFNLKDVRPATLSEIKTYFSEFYGLSVNPDDVGDDAPVIGGGEIPF